MPVLVSRDQESKAAFEGIGAEFDEVYFSKWMTFLTSIACAVWGMSPDEINFESFAASKSSLSGSDTSERLADSKDKGLRPLLAYYEGIFTDYIVSDFDEKFVFRWTGLDDADEDKRHEIRKLITTVNEARAQEGMEAMDGPLGDAPLNPSLIGPWMQIQQAQQQPDTGEREVPPGGGEGGEEGGEPKQEGEDFGRGAGGDEQEDFGGGGQKEQAAGAQPGGQGASDAPGGAGDGEPGALPAAADPKEDDAKGRETLRKAQVVRELAAAGFEPMIDYVRENFGEDFVYRQPVAPADGEAMTAVVAAVERMRQDMGAQFQGLAAAISMLADRLGDSGATNQALLAVLAEARKPQPLFVIPPEVLQHLPFVTLTGEALVGHLTVMGNICRKRAIIQI